jgi:hypothetical protein
MRTSGRRILLAGAVTALVTVVAAPQAWASRPAPGWPSAGPITGYTGTEQDATVPAGGTELEEAYCPSGDVPIGGGGYQSTQTLQQSMETSVPIDSDGNEGWFVAFHNAGSSADTGVAVAMCAAASSLTDYSVVEASVVTVPGNSQTVTTADCPTGAVILGGGWLNNTTGDGADDSAPDEQNWTAVLTANTSEATSGAAFAVCAQSPSGWVERHGQAKLLREDKSIIVAATCPAGKSVLSGGVGLIGGVPADTVEIGLTTPLSGFNGWHTTENVTADLADQYGEAFGICADT